MAIYHQIVFGILLTEITLFLGLIVPLPRSLRRKSLLWIRDNLITKVQYTLKIVFVFVFVLFIDSVNRMTRAQEQSNHKSEAIPDARLDLSTNIQKFYNQRNMYLTGSTLFLSLVLNYTYSLIIEILELDANYNALKLQNKDGDSKANKGEDVTQLKKDLAEARKKVADFDALKKQAEQQHTEYDRMAEELTKLQNQLKNSSESKKSS